jgi:hypothetical protein
MLEFDDELFDELDPNEPSKSLSQLSELQS